MFSRFTKLFLFALIPMVLLAPELSAQALSSGNIATTGAVTAATVTTLSGTSTAVFLVSNGSAGSASWTVVESRKDDGKGPTLELVKASALRLSGKQLPPLHYATLARELGIEPSADEAEMLITLDSLHLKVYNFDKVDGYLYRRALRQKSNMRWVWKPVNEKFLKTIRDTQQAWSDRPGVGLIADSVYANLIPMPIMEQMKALAKVMPEAKYLVSDAAIVDPFLAVTTERLLKAGKLWIIAQWDEPGFGEAPEEPLPNMQISPIAEPQQISKLVH